MTEEARRIIFYARRSVTVGDPPKITTAHLFLGLISVLEEQIHDQTAGELRRLMAGSNLQELRQEIEVTLPQGERVGPGDEIPLSKPAIQVLFRSEQEAHALFRDLIDPSCVLLALLEEGEGELLTILRQAGLDMKEIRARLL